MPHSSLLVLALLGLAAPLEAQAPNGAPAPVDSVSVEGVVRAAAVVDSVFVDRISPSGQIAPGDFGAYLLARLGVEPFPEDLAWRVTADSGVLYLRGRFKDIPEESRGLFGNLLLFVDSTTTLAAEVRTAPAGPGLARFRLDRVLINGVSVPEFVMISVLNSVGREYPALTESGRDLYLQVPPEGRVLILPGRIALDMLARPTPAR
ncbi:MAG: hypothetical protein KJZ47_11715 [Gemmatimonadales bacterium]|nr:hypothetical protein [Gemmatimonadales bacterium]